MAFVYNEQMRLRRTSCSLILCALLWLAACQNETIPPLPTAAPTAALTRSAPGAESALPATFTPAAAAPENTAPLLTEDLEAIDAALAEIDNDICREALETRAEIETLLGQGQDVADLEAAVIELIEELENCTLDMADPATP